MSKVSTTDVAELKRKARILSREADIPHRQALDILARAAGHNHWGSYRSAVDAAASPAGWKHDGNFSAYPPLIDAILSRTEVTAFAVNTDGSAWAAVDEEASSRWTRLAPSEVDDRDVIRDFMDSIPKPLRNPSGLTFLVAGNRTDRHDDRLTARRSSPRARTVEITIRKGPRKDDPRLRVVGDWSLEKPTWHAHLLSARSSDAVRNACDIVVGDDCGTTRLVTLGVKAEARRHPNRVEAFGTLYDERFAMDYAIRVSGDAFVAIADTPARAAAALTMTSMNHGPTAILVDADPADMLAGLTHLVHAGNVSPQRNVREGLAETISLLPERCTLHG